MTPEPFEVVAVNCWNPETGIVTSRGEMLTSVPVGIETFKARFWSPPAVSVMCRLPEKVPTVGEVNWIVTVQAALPATGVALQVSEVIEKVAEPESVTVGVTAPVPRLVAVKIWVIGVEIVVCAVHCGGVIDSGISVGSPVTVTVAVPVAPPLVAVAVTV